MPSLPKWINDTVENVWSSKFKECTVTHIESVSLNLRRIRFSTDLRNVDFEPAYAIGIRVNEKDYRNYSPFSFSKEKDTFEVVFYLHDHEAAGSSFISGLSAGDSIKILMPRGKRFFKSGADIHFSVGDETSLGSSLSIKEAAGETGGSFVCLHELEDPAVLETLGLFGYHTPKNSPLEIIEALNDFLNEEKEAIRNDEVVFYLTGNGTTMSLVRKFLKTKGVSSQCIKSQAYWIGGKKGL